MKDIERIAKLIALYHGSKMVLRRDGETLTVAALAGYGSWGHSAEKYAEAKWQQYDGAAQAVIELMDREAVQGVAPDASPFKSEWSASFSHPWGEPND
jgi:hypothetical protein